MGDFARLGSNLELGWSLKPRDWGKFDEDTASPGTSGPKGSGRDTKRKWLGVEPGLNLLGCELVGWVLEDQGLERETKGPSWGQPNSVPVVDRMKKLGLEFLVGPLQGFDKFGVADTRRKSDLEIKIRERKNLVDETQHLKSDDGCCSVLKGSYHLHFAELDNPDGVIRLAGRGDDPDRAGGSSLSAETE
jgi:hypothetical protein